jgi:iron complex outermembrane receptor protein
VAKHPQPGSRRAHDSLISNLYPSRRSALSLAIAIALGLPGVAMAQQEEVPQESAKAAEAADLEEVIVTGVRAGIQDAIQVKADLQSISEVISAEDIGKLPDTSIADAISRLPGITTQRAEGRASAISLRGTDPGFTTGLMNGREQVSTGDNRAIEYDQYPAELINSVVVYKTPDSNIVGQGLAGTIDLRTVRPLDYGRQAIVLNVRGETNSQGGDLGADSGSSGYRVSFSWVDQFMDGKLGIALGYARLDSPIATKGFGTYEPWGPNGTNAANVDPGVPADAYTTNGMKVRADMGSTIRDGYLATVEFRPNETWGTILDLYYTDMEQTNNARSLEVNLGGYPAPCCDGPFPSNTVFGYSNPTIKRDTVVAGNLNTVVPLARNFLFTTDDQILATGWLNEFRLNDQWKMLADISYSKAERDQKQYETNAQYEPQTTNPNAPRNIYDNGVFKLNPDNMSKLTFGLDYADPLRVQVGPTIYGAGYTKIPHIEDELTSYRVDFLREGELWWFATTSFGVNYSDRTKDKQTPEANLSTINGEYYAVGANERIKPTNLNYADAGKALAWHVKDVLKTYYNPIVYGNPETLPYLAPKYWDVEEKVWTGYVRGDLDHVLSDNVTLKGNIGLQVIGTDQSSGSFEVQNAYTSAQEVLRVSGGKTYTDVLPQINLVFEMWDQQAVRVGLSEQMARARMDQLKATTEVGYNQNDGIPSGSAGNPELDPWRAWAYDVSYEKYFADYKGYVSAAAFYKDLESYIYAQTDTNYDYSDLLATLPPGYFPPGVTPKTTGNYTRPVNGQGGYLYGFEFAVSVPFDIMTEYLNGFGASFSYSYTKSDIEIEGVVTGSPSDNIPLPGLSQDVWNATLYYENYGFAARIATRYRSEYIGEVTNFANDRALRYVDGDQITDAQLSYTFSGDTMMNGLMVLFQVNNLTNEPYIAYSQNKERMLDYQEYGTQYLFGLNYAFH